MSEVVVALVVDPSFEFQLVPLIERAHVWACASKVNESCIHSLWAEGTATYSATLFRVDNAASPAEQAVAQLADLDLHHPGWQVLEVYGVELTPSLATTLRERGAAEFQPLAGGFLARRPSVVEESTPNGMLAQS